MQTGGNLHEMSNLGKKEELYFNGSSAENFTLHTKR